MARIENYQKDRQITRRDYLLGTDGDDHRKTKSYSVKDLTEYFRAKIGRTKVRKRLGNIGSTPVSEYINKTGPYTEVIFTCTINGVFKTYVYEGEGDLIGYGQTQTKEEDFQDLSQAPNDWLQSWTIDNWKQI